MKIKKNDTVLLLNGKGSVKNSRGDSKKDAKKGKVLAVFPKSNTVLVDGMNIQTKHKKARSAQEVSEIKKQAGPINASNLMVICPACEKPTRVGYKVEGDKKVRICKKCGAVLDVANKEGKSAKKETASKKETTAKKTKKTTATKVNEDKITETTVESK